jgi:predicted acylesterase/phospholipase RssA
MSDAFILSGGVAKGAFAAGAIAALTRDEQLGLNVHRVVATSSGALNGVYVAACARAGTLRGCGATLEALWRTDATLRAFDPTLSGALSLRGLSTSAKLLALMRRYIRPSEGRHPIELRLVMTTMAGDDGGVGHSTATTFEHVARFHESAFDDEARLEDIFQAVTASAAFPLAFLPVMYDIHGEEAPCFDGGIVNNTPLKHALDGARVTRVFVITPFPAVLEKPLRPLRGTSLLEQLSDILVNERLYRDLREAHSVNTALERLEARLPDPVMRAAALDALGWTGRRKIEIVEIRPPHPLEGGAFDGFLSPRLRDEYIRLGEQAALVWLASQPPSRRAA